MAEATHTAVDGSTVRLTGDLDLGRAATSSMHLERDGVLRELTTAPVDAIAELPFTTVETYQHRGGTVRIGERTEVDPRLDTRRRDRALSWLGATHGLVVVETGAATEVLLALLDDLTLEETPTGLAVSGPGALPATTTVAKELPGVGLAELAPLVPEVARALPRWAGTEVAGGELYRDEARPGSPVLVLVGDTAVATVLLDPVGAESTAPTSAVADLTVTWTPPDP